MFCWPRSIPRNQWTKKQEKRQMKLSDKYELKPCPFCGGKAYFVLMLNIHMELNTIKCERCGASIGPLRMGRAGVANMWNRRIDSCDKITKK